MADRNDQPTPPNQRGPWPEVTEPNQLFDHGAPWCMNGDGHPHYDYPDQEIHFPYFECRTWGLSLRTQLGLNEGERVVEAYVARPFLFGSARDFVPDEAPRLVLELTDDRSEVAFRFSLTLGDALRMADHIGRLVDVVDVPIER